MGLLLIVSLIAMLVLLAMALMTVSMARHERRITARYEEVDRLRKQVRHD